MLLRPALLTARGVLARRPPPSMAAVRSLSMRALPIRAPLRPPLLRQVFQLSTQAAVPEEEGPRVVWKLRHLEGELPTAMRQAYGPDNMSASEAFQLTLQGAIRRWQRTPLDTGSSEVQIAVFTERILRLSRHMENFHKDKHTKRRLQLLVLQRNRMLKYLRRKDRARYQSVIDGLSIRPTKNFDPTISTRSGWAKKGLNKYVPKKRKPRARSYGEAKSPKGRTRLERHANRQRRLQRERDEVVRTEQRAAAVARRASARAEAAAAAAAARDER
jgi:small subunit ribosomal protein S15